MLTKAADALADAYAAGHHVTVGLRGGQLDVDGLVAQLGLCHEVGQRQVGVGAGDEVGMMVLQQVVLHTLGHASQHSDDESALALHGIEGLQPVVDLLFGIVAHRAGVEEYGIGVFQPFTGLVAAICITEATTSESATFIWQP